MPANIFEVTQGGIQFSHDAVNSLDKKIENVGGGGTTYYQGEAAPGSTTTADLWRVKRIAVVGDVTSVSFADGSPNFNKSWDGRTGYTYV